MTKVEQKSYIEELGGDAGEVLERYAYRVSDSVKSSIKGDVSNDPVAKQYIPQEAELLRLPEEDDDPIGDEAHSPVKGIVHRYPDRVLFKPVNVCAVYCRYCFRREMVGPGSEVISSEDITAALDYIAAHPEIYEVILTGGDPLVLSPKKLDVILTALNDIQHVRIVRIHSRVPIADPSRISLEILKVLKIDKPLYLVVHINHVQELAKDVQEALKALHAVGVSLLSQSVLLRGVNDAPDILEDLFRSLLGYHVKPYYLHHPDFATGTSHFRVSISDGQRIMRTLLGRLTGLAMPTYMLDIPGGAGKIPLTPCYIKELEEGGYNLQDYKGGSHQYPPKG